LEAVDEPVDEPPPTQEVLTETNAGTVTQEGENGEAPPPPVEVEEPTVFTIVEEMPSFPGGEAELFKYLGKTVKYPPMAQDAGITGVVYMTFVVDEHGKVKDPKVLRGIGGGCDEEAIRVVKAMPPWEPGKQRGKPVRVQYNLPIRFTLK
ncbi:MAG: energy transducer TonB, partial [Flavobacteriales bacterium]